VQDLEGLRNSALENTLAPVIRKGEDQGLPLLRNLDGFAVEVLIDKPTQLSDVSLQLQCLAVAKSTIRELDPLLARDVSDDRLRALHLLEHGLRVVDAQQPVDPALQVEPQAQRVVGDPDALEALLLGEQVRKGEERH
jgi:ABC-type phosphonate transport system ATPase subunit